MQNQISNRDLLQYLKSLDFTAGFVDKLKVYYRPLVCPFVDLIGLLKPGEKIGDVGCGSGQFCLLLAEFAKPSYIFGIEINDRLVENARQLFDRYAHVPYHFEKFDGVHFPDAIGELDVVFLNDVLHHVPKDSQHQFIKSLLAKMKPGARLIIKDINGASPLVYFNKMHDLVFAGEIGNELPHTTVDKWLGEEGAKVLAFKKQRLYVYPHYTIVAEKH